MNMDRHCAILRAVFSIASLFLLELVSKVGAYGTNNDEDFYFWNSSDPRSYARLQICDDDRQYEIHADRQCSKGLHFPAGYTPQCICPFGLWIVKTKICAMDTHFLLGDARHICYLVDFEIDSLIYLGDPHNVYASKAFVASFQLRVFYEIPTNGSYTHVLDLDKPMIIHMFPINNRSIETEDGNCFPLIQPNPSKAPVHIWSASLGPTRYRVVDRCQDPLNFGFDDLISPNMVFIRSNRINEIPIPKLHQCSQRQITNCNQDSQTLRPSSRLHIPKNHETLYYDLAKVSSTEVSEKERTPAKNSFHSVEVMDPKEGNFSKFFGEQTEKVELPVMISAKTYKELLSHSSHEQTEKLWKGESSLPSTQTDEAADNQDDLFADITKDIMMKDPSWSKNFLKQFRQPNEASNIPNNISPFSQQNGEHEHDHILKEADYEYLDADGEGGASDSVNKYEQKRLHTTTRNKPGNTEAQESESLKLDFHSLQENLDEPIRHKRTGYSDGEMAKFGVHHKSTKTEMKSRFDEKYFPAKRNKSASHDKHLHENKKYEQYWNSFEADPSGVCKGQLDPPNCKAITRNSHVSEEIQNYPYIKDIVSGGGTNGVNYLTALIEDFESRVSNDFALAKINSLFDQVVALLMQSCHIPERIVSTINMRKALQILLAQIDKNNLWEFYTDILHLADIGQEEVFEKCVKDAGTIKFLFYFTCPLRISCVKYSLTDKATVKLISSERGRDGIKSILASSFLAPVHFFKLMCPSELSQKIDNFSKHHELDYVASAQSKYTEEELRTFLEISNLPAFFLILDKCVSAAETILENRGGQVESFEESLGKRFLNAKIRRRRKRSANNILNGKAICMKSYWDGINKSRKDHACIPSQIT